MPVPKFPFKLLHQADQPLSGSSSLQGNFGTGICNTHALFQQNGVMFNVILSYPLEGLFEYLFMFWSAKGYERIIKEILRRSAISIWSLNLGLSIKTKLWIHLIPLEKARPLNLFWLEIRQFQDQIRKIQTSNPPEPFKKPKH